FQYFRQLFAQVSNPPLDAYREEIVTSQESFIGPESNLFDETAQHARLLKLKEAFLTNREMAKIRDLNRPGLRSQTLSTLFDVDAPDGAMGEALDKLNDDVEAAVRAGV